VATVAGAQSGSPFPITQISANTQPGWGKVYAMPNRDGRFVALFSNGDLAPGAPGNGDGTWEVFRWRSDGRFDQITEGGVERPPTVRVGTSAPSISADGRRIAFSSIRDLTPGAPGNGDGSREIFLWQEGSGLRQITDTRDQDPADHVGSHHPWISADGRRIVFASDLHGRAPGAGIYADVQTDVYLWEDGIGTTRLTTVASASTRAWMPRLAGDGRRVVFYANADLTPGAPGNADRGPEVFVWTAGVGFTQLTAHSGGRAMGLWAAPAISGDGAVVAFAADSDLTPGAPGNADGSTEVFVWREGAGLEQVTDVPQGSSARSPTLGWDGRVVAFVSTADLAPGAPGNADGGIELYAREPGGAMHQLTEGASIGGVLLPVLSGGAELVAFLSDRDLAVGNPVLTPQTFVIELPDLDPGRPTATPPAGPVPRVCPRMARVIPATVQASALADPGSVYGWGLPLNPSLPVSVANPLRSWLSLLDHGKPHSPANVVVWKAGCP
jgi:Tol biopolymer transport system component